MTKQVFLSYAKEDCQFAHKLYLDLKRRGIRVWFDEVCLLPGQDWRREIKDAIHNSSYFLALLSSKSVSHIGYVQKELRIALDYLDLFPESSIFILPIRLDMCTPQHDKLKDLHWVDLFPDSNYQCGLQKILDVLRSGTFSLRNSPIEISHKEVVEMIRKHDFYDSIINPTGKGILHVYHRITVEGDETVFDEATGLLWARRGSIYDYCDFVFASEDELAEWLSRLNKFGFASRNDWRLPTLEETMALLEPVPKYRPIEPGFQPEPWQRKGTKEWEDTRRVFIKFDQQERLLHIDDAFGSERVILTADRLRHEPARWRVSLDCGSCGYSLPKANLGFLPSQWGGCDVRPVCSPDMAFLLGLSDGLEK